MREQEWDINYVVFAVLYLYRHYLETRLKSLLLGIHRLKEVPLDLADRRVRARFTKHGLLDLWLWLRPEVKTLFPNAEEKTNNDLIQKRIREEDLEASAFAFRCPIDADGSTMLAEVGQINHGYINLAHVQRLIAAVAILLDGASAGVEYFQEGRDQERAEAAFRGF